MDARDRLRDLRARLAAIERERMAIEAEIGALSAQAVPALQNPVADAKHGTVDHASPGDAKGPPSRQVIGWLQLQMRSALASPSRP